MILAFSLTVLGMAGVVGTLAGLQWIRTRAGWTPVAAWALAAAGSALAAAAGAIAVAGHQLSLAVPVAAADGTGWSTMVVDPLAGLFLVISFGVAVPVTLAGLAGAASRPRLGAAVALVLIAALLVVTADGLFVFLFGWELLTVGFYLVTGFDRARVGSATASVVTAVFGKASGGAVLLGGLLAAGSSGTGQLAGLGDGPNGAARQIAYALLLLGFAIKVGLLPVQVWLPRGYAAAPGPARAVIAGVAVNVGFYGMWRTLQIFGAPPTWLLIVVLLLAGASAVLGIAHAAVHADLRYLIAWSSVENAGVITAGFAAAMAGAAAGQVPLIAAGLLAATAQVVAHALGKSLLFTAAAAAERATGTTDLDLLRGLARRMPWTAAGLVIGSLTLAGLPLTAGFAAEWLTLEALMQQFRIGDLAIQLTMATAGALVALSIGIAGFAFVRLVGLTAFGPSPAAPTPTGRADRATGLRVAIGALGAGCLGAAAFAPLLVHLVAAGLAPIAGDVTEQALVPTWVPQPVYAEFSALSPSWLWIVIPAMSALALLMSTALHGRRWQVRTVPAWASASPGVDRGVGYTSFGYANPVRKVLANLLQTRGELHRELPGGIESGPVDSRTADSGPADSGGTGHPADHTAASVRLGYTVDVVEVVEQHLYRPAARAVQAIARQVTRLQSGRLDAYLAYMLIAVIAVLAVVTAIS